MKECAGKVQHKNKLSAEYALENSNTSKKANIYKCRICKFYHIGTLSKNKSKKIRLTKKAIDNNEHKKKYRKVRKFKY
jgi:hypothetical protein